MKNKLQNIQGHKKYKIIIFDSNELLRIVKEVEKMFKIPFSLKGNAVGLMT